MQVNIKHRIDDGHCYQTVRDLHWPDGVACPACPSTQGVQRSCDDPEPARQRKECSDGHKRFDVLPDIIVAGHHQPLKVWILGLSFMGWHLSNAHRANALDVHHSEAHQEDDTTA